MAIPISAVSVNGSTTNWGAMLTGLFPAHQYHRVRGASGEAEALNIAYLGVFEHENVLGSRVGQREAWQHVVPQHRNGRAGLVDKGQLFQALLGSPEPVTAGVELDAKEGHLSRLVGLPFSYAICSTIAATLTVAVKTPVSWAVMFVEA